MAKNRHHDARRNTLGEEEVGSCVPTVVKAVMADPSLLLELAEPVRDQRTRQRSTALVGEDQVVFFLLESHSALPLLAALVCPQSGDAHCRKRDRAPTGLGFGRLKRPAPVSAL